MKGRLHILFLSVCVVFGLGVTAQDTLTTLPTFSNNNGSSGVSFEVIATSAIKITGISNWYNTATTSTDVWIKQGAINGSGSITVSTANGWTQHQTGASVSATGTGPVFIQNFTPINVAAGDTVSIVLTGSMGYFTATGAATTTFPGAFATLAAGSPSNGFGGTVPNLGFNPRGFLGSVVVELDLLGNCANPFTNVTTDSILSTSAKIDWDPGMGNTSFWLEYGLKGFTPGTGTTISGAYPGTQPPVILTGLSVDTEYDYYIGEICNSGADSIYAVSPYQFSTTKLCAPPTNLAATNIGPSTADISWNHAGGANSFTIYYNGLSTTATASPFTLTNLSGNTNYDIYVVADCGSVNGLSDSIGPVSFLTPCTTVSTYPFTENFDGPTWTTGAPGTINQCWSRDQSTSVPRWQVHSGGTSSSSTGPSQANSGSVYLYLETSGGTTGSNSQLTLPEFDLTSLNVPIFSFYYHMYGATMGSLEVQVSTDTGSTWTTVLTLMGQDQTANADPWKEELVDLTNYKTAFTMVRFNGIRGTSFTSDMAIDDIRMEEAPPCPKPTALSAGNITSSSADISWLSNGTTFVVEYGPNGYAQGTGVLDTVTTSMTTLSGLAGNTTYDVYVLNDCSAAGNGISAWAGPVTFKTLCTAQLTPLFEGFESADAGSSTNMTLPDCWYMYEVGPSTAYGYSTSSTTQIRTGSRAFYTYCVGTASDTFMLISPEIVGMDTSYKRIEMWIRAVNTSTIYDNKVVVGTVSSPSNPGSFNPIDTLDIGANTTYAYFQVFIDPTNGYNQSDKFIAIMTAGAGSTLPTLVTYDDINISNVPQCIPSSGLSANAITSTSATLNWIAGAGAGYQIEYGPTGFVQGTGPVINGISTNSYTITNLTDNTCYDAYVRDSCSDGTLSPWFGPITFCTPCAPQNMPFLQDFNTWPPSCFDLTNDGGGWDWDQDPAGYARARFWTYSTGIAYMTSSPINISQAAQVKFKWAHQYSTVYPDDRLILRARLVGTNNWDTLVDLVGPTFDSPGSGTTTPPASASDFIDFLGYLDTSYVGNQAQFQFVAITDWGPYAYVDDFEVEGVPGCTPPFNANVSNVTSSGAQVNWSTINGNCFKIEYGPVGFVQGTGNGTVINNTTSPTTISGLNPNTAYDVYVADCCDSTNFIGPITFQTLCLSQLNGAYTVGGPTADFTTLDSAMTTLTSCGVSGPVTFNLQGGTHIIGGQLIDDNVAGLNSTNTVTISGGGPAVDTILFGAGATMGFDFDGGGNFSFEDVTINGSATQRTFWLHNGANNISFDNCHLWNSPSATLSSTGVIVGSATNTSNFSSGDNANNISITDCKIVGGYCGVIIYGPSTTTYGSNVTVDNCVFENVNYYAMRFYYMSDITVVDNVVDPVSPPVYAMYSYYWNDIQIERNQFFGTTSGLYSGYVNIYRTDTPSVTSTIKNNFISGGSTYANYNFAARHLDFTHNTVVGTGTYGAYFSATTTATLASFDVDMYNNIFVGGNNYALYAFASNFQSLNSDYNLYFTGGTNLAYWNAARTDLTALKAADLNQNQNSISGNPGLASPTDFHIVGTLPNDAGVNGYATDDIDGDSRPASGSSTVDIGADEYTPLNNDVSALGITEPSNLSCGDSNAVVSVAFANFGLLNATNVSATVNITGAITATLTGTYNGPLASLGVDTITVGTFNTAGGGTINIEAIITTTNDQNTSNDTVFTTVTINDILPRIPLATADTVCAGDFSTLYYPPNTMNMSFQWLTTTGDTIGTADSLQVGPMGSSDTTFILDPVSASEHVGPLDNTIGAGGNYTAMNHYLLFTVTQATTIISVDVFANGPGLVDVVIQDGTTSATLFTNTVSISTGGLQTLVINQPLQPGTYRMGGTTTNNAGGLYRNSAGAVYPYTTSDGSVSITGNTFNPAYYYFFYNWLVGAGGCPRPQGTVTIYNGGVLSAAFTPTVNTPTATDLTVDFDASASVGATSYDWNFGDGSPNGSGMNVSHSYTANGTYTVTLVVTGSCGTDTLTQQVVIAGIGLEETLIGQTLNLYPNPNNGNFRVEFQVEGLKEVELRVVSLLGQVMYESKPGNISGTYREEIDLSDEAAGVYVLQVVSDDATISRRVTIRK